MKDEIPIPKARILFVDDEEGIRRILAATLKSLGYDVVVAATVAEAVALIGSSAFDVLLSDLNIGEPGDGFTVVSAMRRTQPDAATLILTGYPDFDSALNAIRNQVDDYITKPPDFQKLAVTIEGARQKRRVAERRPANKRVADLIEENAEKICQDWLSIVEANSHIKTRMAREDRLAHVPEMLKQLVSSLRAGRELPRADQLRSASNHGKVRREQGCSVPELIEESRVLQRCIYDVLHSNIFIADMSWLLPDVIRVSDSLQEQLAQSVEAFAAPTAGPPRGQR